MEATWLIQPDVVPSGECDLGCSDDVLVDWGPGSRISARDFGVPIVLLADGAEESGALDNNPAEDPCLTVVGAVTECQFTYVILERHGGDRSRSASIVTLFLSLSPAIPSLGCLARSRRGHAIEARIRP